MPRKKQEVNVDVERVYHPDPVRMKRGRELYAKFLLRKVAEKEGVS